MSLRQLYNHVPERMVTLDATNVTLKDLRAALTTRSGAALIFCILPHFRLPGAKSFHIPVQRTFIRDSEASLFTLNLHRRTDKAAYNRPNKPIALIRPLGERM